MNAPLRPSMLQPGSSSNWPEGAIPEAWIDSLFTRMIGMYGSKFADLWRGTDLQSVRRIWGTELATLSRAELKLGAESLRNRPFPPTLPEFVALCRPPVNYDAALYESARQIRLRIEGKDEWPNPAFYWAALKVGEFDMMNLGHAPLLRRFTAALDEVMRGEIEPVPPRAIAIPAPGKTRAQPDRVHAEVAKAKAFHKDVGSRDWAHAVIKRADGKDKPSIAVLNMAKRALGNHAGNDK